MQYWLCCECLYIMIEKYKKKQTTLRWSPGNFYGRHTALNALCCWYKTSGKSRSIKSNQTKIKKWKLQTIGFVEFIYERWIKVQNLSYLDQRSTSFSAFCNNIIFWFKPLYIAFSFFVMSKFFKLFSMVFRL